MLLQLEHNTFTKGPVLGADSLHPQGGEVPECQPQCVCYILHRIIGAILKNKLMSCKAYSIKNTVHTKNEKLLVSHSSWFL